MDVIALKTKKMRGQAHVVFRDIQTSTQAMRALQGFEFFGKEMVRYSSVISCLHFGFIKTHLVQKIQYGKGRSNVFTRLEGVYRPPNATTTATDLQQSIFNAPLPSTNVTATSTTSIPPRPAEPITNGDKAAEEASQGVKRRREDESDEEEAPIDEDDDDVSMEASSDED